MECVAACAAGGFALADVAVVAVMVLAAALALAVLSVVLGYAWVLALAVAVAIPPALWLLARVCKYGPTLEVFRRHQRQRPVRVPQRRAVTTGQPMLEQGRIEVTPDMILGPVKEARHVP